MNSKQQQQLTKHLPLAATFLCGYYVADNKLAEALLVGGLYFLYSSEFSGHVKYAGDKKALVAVPQISCAKVVESSTAVPYVMEQVLPAAAVEEEILQPPLQPTYVNADEGPSLSGQSKYRFEQQFTLLPHQRSHVTVATPVEGPSRPSAQAIEENESRNSFYQSMASGGDMAIRKASGLHTLDYLCASATT